MNRFINFFIYQNIVKSKNNLLVRQPKNNPERIDMKMIVHQVTMIESS